MGYAKCINEEYALEDEEISPLSDITNEASLCQVALEVPSAVSEVSSLRNLDNSINKKASDSSFISTVAANIEMQEIAASFTTDNTQADDDNIQEEIPEDGNSKLPISDDASIANNSMKQKLSFQLNGNEGSGLDNSFVLQQNDNFNTGYMTESSPRKLEPPHSNDSDEISELTNGNSCMLTNSMTHLLTIYEYSVFTISELV